MTGFVYFAQALSGGAIKIGYSIDPIVRLRQLQTTAAERLRLIGLLPGTEIDEKRIHHALAPYRLHGEWFADVPEVLDVLTIDVVEPTPVPVEDEIAKTLRHLLGIRDMATLAISALSTQDVDRVVELLDTTTAAIKSEYAA